MIYKYTYTAKDCFLVRISKICHFFLENQFYPSMPSTSLGWKSAGGKGGWYCLPSMALIISGGWGIADAELWDAWRWS